MAAERWTLGVSRCQGHGIDIDVLGMRVDANKDGIRVRDPVSHLVDEMRHSFNGLVLVCMVVSMLRSADTLDNLVTGAVG